MSAERVSVNVLRLAESSCGGSIALGPAPVSRSQLVKPGSVDPALTCGSSRSAPVAGARPSGTQPVDVACGARVGSACGVKVEV